MPDGFGADVCHGDEAAVVTVWGEIDLHTSPHCERIIDAAFRNRSRTVVIDMTEVTFFGAAGVHALTRAQQRAAAEDRDLQLLPSPQVARVLEVLDLHALLGAVCYA